MNIRKLVAAAVFGALVSGTAMATESPAVPAGEPSAMLKSAVQILKQEQRKSLRRNLRADWLRMSDAVTEEMRQRQVAGGPANATVKSEP